ncbi:hypothetical protein CFPU101_45230 [Chroococcus sp. FPU101]|nr:hypothetical protein CFPU101_45230 [Chroococcus sp. FPU101]
MSRLAHSDKVLLSLAFTLMLKLVSDLSISIALIAIANPLLVLAEQVCQVTEPLLLIAWRTVISLSD